MPKTRLILSAVLVWTGVVWLLLTPAAAAPLTRKSDDLWFGLRINAGLVDWFNQTAQPADVAAATIRQVALLDQIKAGQRQVLFTSVTEAEKQVPGLVGKIDIIGYDLEHWPQTPAEEQVDPVAAMRRLRALADRYGLTVTVGPDRRFAVEYGAQLAPYADQFVLQVQRLQQDPAAVQNFARPLIGELRQANADLEIAIQLRTEGRVEDLIALVDSLRGEIDGVSIIYSSTTVGVAQDLVARLRTGEPYAPSATTPPETAMVETAAPSPTLPSRTVGVSETITPSPTPSSVSDRTATPSLTPGSVSDRTAMPLPTLAATPTPLPTPSGSSPGAGLVIGLVMIVLLAGGGLIVVLTRRRGEG